MLNKLRIYSSLFSIIKHDLSESETQQANMKAEIHWILASDYEHETFPSKNSTKSIYAKQVNKTHLANIQHYFNINAEIYRDLTDYKLEK